MAESGMSSLELATKHFNSFGGTDIRVVIAGSTSGTLQALSYAVRREKAPNYVLGTADPVGFSRGKRGIAGTLVSLMFDEHMIKKSPFNGMKFVADKDELKATRSDLLDTLDTNDISRGDGFTSAANVITTNYVVTDAWYADQLPPFDAIIIAQNEYGGAATMRIYGIEIMTEGGGFSIDDMQLENQMNYICRTLLPWQKLGRWNVNEATGALEGHFTAAT